QYRSQSLIEHLRIAWRTSGQLPDFFVTVVPPQMRSESGWYRGTADAVLQNLNLIDDFNADVIAIFGADHIYRMDVTQMLAFHRPRLRPLDHPRARAGQARVRLRLPDERRAGGETVRGAGLLARRRHDRGLLGGPHGPPRRVAALRPRQPHLAGPECASSRP